MGDIMLGYVYDVVEVLGNGLVKLESPVEVLECCEVFLFPPEALTIVEMKFCTGSYARITPKKRKLIDAFNAILDRYEDAPEGKGRYHPGMDDMLAGVFSVITVQDDGLVGLPAADGSGVWLFPPGVLEILEGYQPPLVYPKVEVSAAEADAGTDSVGEETVSTVPEEEEVPFVEEELPVVAETEPQETPPPPAPAAQTLEGLAIQCWTLPSESNRARMERAMGIILEQLIAAGIVLPSNIAMASSCREADHSGCFVYRFGTRRLHLSTRMEEDGRLLVVVRCGGGFADFAEFARRHGSLENIKYKRQSGGPGKGVLRLNSVLSKGSPRLRSAGEANQTTL